VSGYVIRRLLALLPTLFIASVIVFVTIRMIPGDTIDLMMSQNDTSATRQSREQLEAALGLDKPMHVQYVSWISAILLHGDMGQSLWTSSSVGHELQQRLPVTFTMGVMALLVSLAIGIPIGVYAAIRQDTLGDYALRTFSVLLLAVPGFWIGTLVMVFPSIWWGWSPSVRFVPFSVDPVAYLLQLAIPAVILGGSLSAIVMRLTRALMLEVLRQDYIRTARAKGLPVRVVVIRHALRNALVPVVTLVGIQAPLLFGGAVILEQIFVIPGIGLLLLESVANRDYPMVTGVFLVVGVAVLFINFLVDLSYGFLDPKMRAR